MTGNSANFHPSLFALAPFIPRRWLGNTHAQTIAGNYFRRPGPLPEPEALIVPVEPPHAFTTAAGERIDVPETSVLCLCHWQAEAVRTERPPVVLVHGLEAGCSRPAATWCG